jgi:hypothetical protein
MFQRNISQVERKFELESVPQERIVLARKPHQAFRWKVDYHLWNFYPSIVPMETKAFP